tara:strand:+ start:8752 stop:9282 length:531 start_codon:yes stop_codon:yes gene_type:complete
VPIHAMIDLETLDVTPQASVLTVGGVKFDPLNDTEPHSEFYFKLDLDAQSNRKVNDSTIAWWGTQDKKVQEEAFSEDGRTDPIDFLEHLPKWMVGVDVLWGHGYGFDITIIEDMLRQVNKPIPWQFWQVRDSRTLFAMAKVDPRKAMQSDLHNALADAYFQAKGVQMVYKELGVKK